MTAGKRFLLFLVTSMAAVVAVEFGGIGVFTANRTYWDRFEAARIEQALAEAPMDPSAVHEAVVEQYGPGAGVLTGLWHGSLGIPRVFLTFAATIANHSFGARIYTSPDPVFAMHNRGEAYTVGFAIGVILFIVLFATLLPNPRPPPAEA